MAVFFQFFFFHIDHSMVNKMSLVVTDEISPRGSCSVMEHHKRSLLTVHQDACHVLYVESRATHDVIACQNGAKDQGLEIPRCHWKVIFYLGKYAVVP